MDASIPISLNLPSHFHIPPPNPSFHGRRVELKQLEDVLLPCVDSTSTKLEQPLRQFAICGARGIGKSELARAFARKHLDKFDAVFWVDGEDVMRLDEQFREIALTLGLETESAVGGVEESREAVRRWLGKPRRQLSESNSEEEIGDEATWLLVFDNADKPYRLQNYLPIPNLGKNGSLLVTSWDETAKIFPEGPSGLYMGPLSQQDSIDLLQHFTALSHRTAPEQDLVLYICDLLGGSPTVLCQMGKIIRAEGWTYDSFLHFYETRNDVNNPSNAVFHLDIHRARILFGAWGFHKLSPLARQLLDTVAFLNAMSISEGLASQLAASINIAGIALKKYHDPHTPSGILWREFSPSFLNELYQSSLIRKSDLSRRELSTHRVIQDIIFAALEPRDKSLCFEAVVRVIWSNWPAALPRSTPLSDAIYQSEATYQLRTFTSESDGFEERFEKVERLSRVYTRLEQPKSTGGMLDVKRWPECAALLPHIARLHEIYPTLDSISENVRLTFGKLLNEAAWYMKERGQIRHFEGLFKTARVIFESSRHPERLSLLADIHFCLGSLAMDTNDFENSRIHKEASFDITYGICHPLIKESVSDDLPEVPRMIRADERLVLAYTEMGVARVQEGRLKEGEAFLNEARRVKKELRDTVPGETEVYLGYALIEMGRADDAQTLLTESLEAWEKSAGEKAKDFPRTGLFLRALGNVYAAMGDWDESFSYHKKALRFMVGMPEPGGQIDLYTASIAYKVAEHHLRQGEYEEALDLLKNALRIWTLNPNAHQNDIARATFMKGNVLLAMGNKKEALDAYKSAARDLKKVTKLARTLDTLTIVDFDQIVAFYHR